MDSFIMFVATIAVIITTQGESYGYAFTLVFGITVFTLLKKSHALIFYLICSLVTIYLSIFVFNSDVESLFNLFIIIILSVVILFTFNYSQESLIMKLTLMSRKDVLTGLWNRNMYYKVLRKEIKSAMNNQEPLSIMMVDIDFFKDVNDTYGHYTGDEYLKFISNFFLNNIRQIDTVARWGGEEFSFIFPKTPKEDALKIARRILKQLRNTNHEKVGKVTISMGLTTFIKGEDYNDLFKRADQALYLSKDNGRDRVTVL
jgi:diguanylate cyclase (GGDEF)-like protein